MITASIMLATIMQGVDNTIANVALPHIQGSLSAAQDQIAWVLTSYIVAVAIMTPLTGWLAGRVGIKHVFLISVAGFTLASALCGSATSLTQLVIYRVLQGACGAGLVPLSQSVLMQINPPERHGQAIAIWGIGVMLGPIFGPMLGGWLTQDYSWRWIFYINLPVGVIASLGILVFIRETRHTHREAFDFFGFVTLSIAVGALQLLLDHRQRPLLHQSGFAEEPQLHGRYGADVLCRRHSQRHPGAVADDAAVADELPGVHDRAGNRAARHRHDGRDVPRRAHDQPGRQPTDHPRRVSADGAVAVADDGVFATDGNGARHLVGFAAGLRAWLHFRAAQHFGPVEPAAPHHDARDGDA